MSRYNSDLWKQLESIQNELPQTDILTITAFMNDSEFENHVKHNQKRLDKIKGKTNENN